VRGHHCVFAPLAANFYQVVLAVVEDVRHVVFIRTRVKHFVKSKQVSNYLLRDVQSIFLYHVHQDLNCLSSFILEHQTSCDVIFGHQVIRLEFSYFLEVHYG
jgi:hypothetical protein